MTFSSGTTKTRDKAFILCAMIHYRLTKYSCWHAGPDATTPNL